MNIFKPFCILCLTVIAWCLTVSKCPMSVSKLCRMMYEKASTMIVVRDTRFWCKMHGKGPWYWSWWTLILKTFFLELFKRLFFFILSYSKCVLYKKRVIFWVSRRTLTYTYLHLHNHHNISGFVVIDWRRTICFCSNFSPLTSRRKHFQKAII